MTDICETVYNQLKNKINQLMDNLSFYEKNFQAGYEAAFGICQINKNVFTTTRVEEDLMGEVELPTKCPDSSKLVGAFHTHPAAKYFGTQDIITTINNNLDFTCLGYYDEKKDKPMLRCLDLSKSDKKKIYKETLNLHTNYLTEKLEKKLTKEKSLKIITLLEDKIKELGGEYCELPIEVR